MDAIKLYFFIFLLIFGIRAGLKWRDTPLVDYEPQDISIAVETESDFTPPHFLRKEAEPMKVSVAFYVILVLTELIALLGIFGMAFNKQIFFPLFWKIFLVPFIAVEGYLIYTTSFQEAFLVFLYSLALILPAPYTIFLYGFKYKWVTNTKTEETNDAA
jgi:hypothetical protein